MVSEILKSYMNAGKNLRDVWFYRDAKKREIDLVIQEGRTLHPVEIKLAATVGQMRSKTLRLSRRSGGMSSVLVMLFVKPQSRIF